MCNRVKSFIWGGIAAAAALAIGIYFAISSKDAAGYAFAAVFSVLIFTLVSCLILDNNFVGDMIAEIFSWGFVRMPGLIFTLDLDGIIWLLTVKLLFWILGIVLAVICGILGIAIGLIVSIFVYPFALYKSFTEPDDN
jgi:hypothetical protein